MFPPRTAFRRSPALATSRCAPVPAAASRTASGSTARGRGPRHPPLPPVPRGQGIEALDDGAGDGCEPCCREPHRARAERQDLHRRDRAALTSPSARVRRLRRAGPGNRGHRHRVAARAGCYPRPAAGPGGRAWREPGDPSARRGADGRGRPASALHAPPAPGAAAAAPGGRRAATHASAAAPSGVGGRARPAAVPARGHRGVVLHQEAVVRGGRRCTATGLHHDRRPARSPHPCSQGPGLDAGLRSHDRRARPGVRPRDLRADAPARAGRAPGEVAGGPGGRRAGARGDRGRA